VIEQAKLLANDFSNNNSNYNIGGKDELRMVADPD
jgi:hypothetical protein